jgi:hypothetical protein
MDSLGGGVEIRVQHYPQLCTVNCLYPRIRYYCTDPDTSINKQNILKTLDFYSAGNVTYK